MEIGGRSAEIATCDSVAHSLNHQLFGLEDVHLLIVARQPQADKLSRRRKGSMPYPPQQR